MCLKLHSFIFIDFFFARLLFSTVVLSSRRLIACARLLLLIIFALLLCFFRYKMFHFCLLIQLFLEENRLTICLDVLKCDMHRE